MSEELHAGHAQALAKCEESLRTADYIETHSDDGNEEMFLVLNPVPLTLDNASFREVVETHAAQHGLSVHPAGTPHQMIVAAPGVSL